MQLLTNNVGGNAMFLGGQDIQLGVNETLYDTTHVVSSMVDGIMARVGGHDEILVNSFILQRKYEGQNMLIPLFFCLCIDSR